MEEGRVQWAQSGDLDIAFRVLGDGPVDIVFLSGITSHVEVLLEEPGLRRWWERLGSIARVILIDRRGLGLSDRPSGRVALEDEVADLDAVLDAAGCDRVVVQAYAAGGPLAIEYAARRPDRTLALILYAAIVATEHDDEAPWADTPTDRAERLARLRERWGSGANIERMAPSVAGDPRMRAWMGKLERQSATPSGFLQIAANLQGVDVRAHLPNLRVPTLVLHRIGDQLIDVGHSRLSARLIPGARLVELPGTDSLPMIGDTEALLGEIEEFLTGSRTATSGLQRRLMTILFTDIVDATGHAARMGDARWRDLLSAHDNALRREVERYGGREVKTLGDGYIAAFEGPPSDALRCARTVTAGVRGLGIQIRAGLHTGECELIGGDVGGMAVHIAARVCDMAEPEEILMSGTTYGTVVGSGLECEMRGAYELRGVPGPWPIFALQR
ncbi:Haloalkane dehalogenase [Baekduia alba]|uniref:adenylate/guanylate cyclase domain-containing protein n=1 Tax=Baekduia alba TaxID=2997333 RepID=UPI00233FF451|nr:adenylate/guanylate cyclase domain-containing protein [Baekduia alba]WCB95024.1 Haloalkane dehalogenase [Baekduia alba]